MSDYVQNQEYSMQLAAPEDDPYTYDWVKLQEEVDEVKFNPFADITLASLQEDIDVDAIDWAAVTKDLDNGPWRDLFDWNAYDQGADAQPGDRIPRLSRNGNGVANPSSTKDSFMTPHPGTEELAGTSAEASLALVCDFPDCRRGLKPFAHKGDLVRHRRLHDRRRQFPCTAPECKFSFTRKDKLIDHICAGHDNDTLFHCPTTNCQVILTRDILPLHVRGLFRMSLYRQCPLPKCGFRTSIHSLETLQHHLRQGHELRGREKFARLLAEHGYDYRTANILCPICPGPMLFEDETQFRSHLIENHCPDVSEHASPYEPFDGCKAFSDEVREHCRAILSVCPKFKYHAGWDDIRRCPS